MPEIDFRSLMNDAKDVVLPDGDYVVIVSKVDAVTASTGKPMLKLQLTIADGPKRDRKIFTQLVLSADNPFALQRWFSQLACFGLDHTYFNANPTLEKIATDLVNRGAIVTLVQREWQGSMRNDVQAYKPYVPSGPVPPGMILGPVTSTGPTSSPAPSSPTTPSAPPTVSPTSVPSAPPPARPF